MTQLRVGIIGCGLIGYKRAASLGSRAKLVACSDINHQQLRKFSSDTHSIPFDSYIDLLRSDLVDIAIIATPHNNLASICSEALRHGKHVLIEKPASDHSTRLLPLIALAQKLNLKVHVGFNHRYHRSLLKAKEIVDSGSIGPLMFIRARYGHGGRPGYDKEWRAIPEISGGGELIDQGVHLIDLCRLFLGDFEEVDGYARTFYWNMPVDDNAFLLLKTPSKQVAHLHVSCTEWKNLFSFEIYGRLGKLDISGLGGSYGVEKITHYHLLPEMGPPDTICWEYPMADNSWLVEFEDFVDDILEDRKPTPNLQDAYETLRIVEAIYKSSSSTSSPDLH